MKFCFHHRPWENEDDQSKRPGDHQEKSSEQKSRQEEPLDMGLSTWELVRELLKAGEIDEALFLIDQGLAEDKAVHDNLVNSVGDYLKYFFSLLPEEEIEKILRERYFPTAKRNVDAKASVEKIMQGFIRYQRANGSSVTIRDEPDRYVVTYHPCGSGGFLIKNRSELRLNKAYPWSWSKPGINYYCLHCCIAWEIIPTELADILYTSICPRKAQRTLVSSFITKGRSGYPRNTFPGLVKSKGSNNFQGSSN
jgi:hypothetical protein